MQLEHLTLKLPRSVAREVQEREILSLLLDRAFSKLEYYRSRIHSFEKKYGCKLSEMEQRLLSSPEDFVLWEDFILWEGYQRAFEEWRKKYEELKSVLQNYSSS